MPSLHPDMKSKPLISFLGPLLMVLLLIPSLVWAWRDQSVWPWDQAWYARCAVALAEAQKSWDAFLHVLPTKPPGHVWWAHLFVFLAPSSSAVSPLILFSVVMTTGAALYVIGWTLKHLIPENSMAILTVNVMALSAPLLIGLSTQFFSEPLQMLAVAWFLAIALDCPRWPRLNIVFHLMAASSLGMLSKISTPLYVVLPGCLTLWVLVTSKQPWIGNNREDRLHTLLAALLALILTIPALSWYTVNVQQALLHMKNSSYAENAALWGRKMGFVDKFIVWLGFCRTSLFHPLFFWPATVVLMGVGVQTLRNRREMTWFTFFTGSHRRKLVTLCLLNLLLVLAVFSTQINEDYRYLLALLPLFCVITASLFRHPTFRWPLWILLILFFGQWLLVHLTALGKITPVKGLSHYVIPCEKDSRRLSQVRLLIRSTCNETTRQHPNLMGVSTPWANVLTLNYYASLEPGLKHGPLPFYNYGWRESDPHRALSRIRDLNPRYYIIPAPDFFPEDNDPQNQIASTVLQAILQSGDYIPHPVQGLTDFLILRNRHIP